MELVDARRMDGLWNRPQRGGDGLVVGLGWGVGLGGDSRWMGGGGYEGAVMERVRGGGRAFDRWLGAGPSLFDRGANSEADSGSGGLAAIWS
jgi:hypothetical protein